MEGKYVGRVPRPIRRSPGEGGSGPAEVDDVPDVFATASRAEWISAVGWMATFFVMLWLLGALVTVPLFALVYLLAVSRQTPVVAGSYALVSWMFIYGLFDRVLHVPLPAGVLMTPGVIFPIT